MKNCYKINTVTFITKLNVNVNANVKVVNSTRLRSCF